jgi:hypothetical protein
MRIHLRFLRERERIQEALRRDGWALEWEREEYLKAGHPLVHDEGTARTRLQELGLLTNGCVYIDFVRTGNSGLVGSR